MSEYARRSQLRPGQVFVWDSWLSPYERLLVVVDRVSEVDFWTGDRWYVGDADPAAQVEVVS